MAREDSVLVVCKYGGKKRNHLDPLGRTASSVTILSTKGQVGDDDFDHVIVPDVGGQFVTLFLRLIYAILLAQRRDYDVIASISLFPYGLIALVAGTLSGTPVHLGIIGADLDVHAVEWYGAVTRWLLRRFDVVSVTADTYAAQLSSYGVEDSNITVLTNTIPIDQFAPSGQESREYDVAWVGKFLDVKDPMFFVDALETAKERGREFEAVMLGSGPLLPEVRKRLEGSEIEDDVTLTGWVDDPSTYLTRSSVYVSTSSRDAVPLTLLEAMAGGAVPIAPRIGGIPEVIHHGHDGMLYPQGDATALIRTLTWLEDEADLESMREAAGKRVQEHGFDVAAEDWRRILWLALDPD